MSARILYEEEYYVVHCYDKRHEDLTVEVIVNLLTLLVDGYGEPSLELPSPEFLIEAVQYSLDNSEMLRVAWERVQREGPPS